METVEVRVSVASALQRFHGCEPDYIRAVCHARCCDAPGRPTGTLVTIHRTEEAAIRARGGVVADGVLVTPERRCTFKTPEHLCGLHLTPDKPFGCIASPFTLNATDCLIVRNRYRLLPCYQDGDNPKPAYIAFRASLDRIFGLQTARHIALAVPVTAARFLTVPMPVASYEMLRDNDKTKHALR